MYHIFDTVSVYPITFCLNNDINFSQRLLCIHKISFISKESLILCYNFSFFFQIFIHLLIILLFQKIANPFTTTLQTKPYAIRTQVHATFSTENERNKKFSEIQGKLNAIMLNERSYRLYKDDNQSRLKFEFFPCARYTRRRYFFWRSQWKETYFCVESTPGHNGHCRCHNLPLAIASQTLQIVKCPCNVASPQRITSDNARIASRIAVLRFSARWKFFVHSYLVYSIDEPIFTSTWSILSLKCRYDLKRSA